MSGAKIPSGEVTALSPLVRLNKATFRAHIVDGLREAILKGDIRPGTKLVEASLADQFGVSRGPLREAMRQLIDEGLLVTIPYTGTQVIDLSVVDVREIYSMRVTLEIFAFEQIWPHRGAAFRDELVRRHDTLLSCIDAQDDAASIHAELQLHGLVYETARHKLLLKTWESIRGRLQLYWAAHHRAHGLRGPRRDGHVRYVQTAIEDDFAALRQEIVDHMARGGRQTEAFLAGRARDAGGAPES